MKGCGKANNRIDEKDFRVINFPTVDTPVFTSSQFTHSLHTDAIDRRAIFRFFFVVVMMPLEGVK